MQTVIRKIEGRAFISELVWDLVENVGAMCSAQHGNMRKEVKVLRRDLSSLIGCAFRPDLAVRSKVVLRLYL